MSKTAIAALLSLIALPVLAQTGDDLMKPAFGNTVTVEIPGAYDAKIYYDADHTYRQVASDGESKGKWAVKGDQLCATPTEPAGPETCSKLEPRKVGDKWKSTDAASGFELMIGIVEGRK